jgi:drug/metabolite transporter (DMT)-like permease
MTVEQQQARFRLTLILAFAAVYILWGSTYVAIRFAIETLPSLTMAGVRFVVAGTILYGFGRLRGAPPARFEQWRSAAILGILFFLCGNGSVVLAEHRVASGLAALLVGTEPLWVAVLFWLWPGGEAPGNKTILGLGIGFAGTVLLAAPAELAGTGGLHLPSVALVLFACVTWAIASLFARTADLPTSPLVSAGAQMLMGGIALLLAGLAAGEGSRMDLTAASARSWGALVYLIVFGSIVAFTAFGWLVRNVRPTMVATYAYVNPVVAVFLGWLLAGEPVTGRTLLAAILILGAVVLVSRDRPGNGPPRTAKKTPKSSAGDRYEEAGKTEMRTASKPETRKCA